MVSRSCHVLNFSIRNMLLVIAFAGLWIGLILPDTNCNMRIQAFQHQRKLELIQRGKSFEEPISEQEIRAAMKRLKRRLGTEQNVTTS